ncbi:MAG: CARDB domain-containing protein [Syntrophobacteraceae bacterium]
MASVFHIGGCERSRLHSFQLRAGIVLALLLVFFLSATAYSAQLTIAWSRSTDPAVIGYKVYYGNQSRNYPWVINAGANLSYTITGLSASKAYYFALTAYTANAESGFSPELICYFITAATPANGQIAPAGATASASGSSQTFSIDPNAGYQISEVLVDGVSVGAASQYTFSNVSACHTISANFASVTANYTISASTQGSGSISPSGTVSVPARTNRAFTMTPAANYRISDVQVDNVSVGAVSSYTFTNVKANHTIAATFALDTFTITPAAGGDGNISPSTAVQVGYGASQTFTITPAAGYKVANVEVDGVSVGAVESHTFLNVTANHTISASFSPSSTFTITPTAGADGKISPSTAVTVEYGASQTFTITPAPGYRVANVEVDGVPVGPVISRTFLNVTANHTISASFSPLNIFTIIAEAWANGTISPSPAVRVEKGASQTFAITPVAGCKIAGVQVDGVPVGALTSYTFASVTANHTISASFGSVNPLPVADAGPNQIVAGGTNVTLSGSNSTDTGGPGIASYLWTQTGGTPVVLSNPAAVQSSFTAPSVGPGGSAALTFMLTVSDTTGLQATATCIVNVVSINMPPSAKAGPDQTVEALTTVTLNGSKSADSGDGISSYLWEQIDGPAVTLSHPTSPRPTFVAPQVGSGGTSLAFRLTVTDEQGLKSTDTCFVDVTLAAPHAIAGPNRTEKAGSLVTLDGSSSTDRGSGIASFRWRQTGGAPVSLSDPTSAKPTFTPPSVAADGNPLSFSLTVEGNDGQRSRATQVVTVKYNGPDLTGTWSDSSYMSYYDGTFSQTLSVHNAGNQNTTKTFGINFYFSNDGVHLVSLLGSRTAGPLAAGQSQSVYFTARSPSFHPRVYVVAVIDPDGSIPETNKTNNVVKALIP